MASVRSKTTIDPLFSNFDLALALEITPAALTRRVIRKAVPPADIRTAGNCKNWRFSTIRAWRPDIADRLVDALKTVKAAA